MSIAILHVIRQRARASERVREIRLLRVSLLRSLTRARLHSHTRFSFYRAFVAPCVCMCRVTSSFPVTTDNIRAEKA